MSGTLPDAQTDHPDNSIFHSCDIDTFSLHDSKHHAGIHNTLLLTLLLRVHYGKGKRMHVPECIFLNGRQKLHKNRI